jgi:drug/metabolite transporter (DMT)-like permease
MTGIRFVLGSFALLPVVIIFERKKLAVIFSDKARRKKAILSGLAAGIALFSATSIQQFGINTTGSAGITGLITGLYTILVPLACFLLFKTKIRFNVWIGAVCALLGVFLLCYKVGEGFSLGFGELVLFIGTICWTIHFIILDKLSCNLPPLSLSLMQFFISGILGCVFMFVFEEPTMAGVLAAKIPILYCGLLSVGVAYTLQVVAQTKVPASLAVIVLSTESVFSAVGGVIFGIDEMSVFGVIGCVIFFFGIVVSQLEFKKKELPH